jgi:hypothetical protein
MLSDFGHIHPGLDCVIFEAAMVDRFAPFDTIIGMAHVMRPLFFNLIAFVHDPVVLTDAHATFHVGDEREWSAAKYADYDRFNRGECLKVIETLCKRDPALEARLTAFVKATEEHRWIPEGILSVRKRKRSLPLSTGVRRRLIRTCWRRMASRDNHGRNRMTLPVMLTRFARSPIGCSVATVLTAKLAELRAMASTARCTKRRFCSRSRARMYPRPVI